MRVLKKSIWPYQVKLSPKTEKDDNGWFDPREEWLASNMNKDRFYVLGPNNYAFKDERDAVMFSLKWA